MFLVLENIQKLFSEDDGIRNINLSIQEGELLTLLGSSGCGKSTTLNVIGGFLKPDQGIVRLDGREITLLPPEKRPVATVFQSYALFPHMNVIENVSYGLKYNSNLRKKERVAVAEDYIQTVGLAGYEKEHVGNLSGGQQQRVALARALVTKPKVLLLDEPFSNLDAKLRVKMREELKQLQHKFNITMIFVTHDQEEALSISDRIAVMDKGSIVQLGTPTEIYRQPANEYVASFIGNSNIIGSEQQKQLVRPEDIQMVGDELGDWQIIYKVFMGAYVKYTIAQGERELEVTVSGITDNDFAVGDCVRIEIQHMQRLS